MAQNLPPDLWGLNVNGDACGLTIYTRKNGKKVFFRQAPPEKPASAAQLVQRFRFRCAVKSWLELPQTERDLYNQAADVLSLCMTGVNLWVLLSLKTNNNLFHTISNQAHLPLLPPPPQ
jgi:hypothetical protein